jgi:hypothetical protein
MQRIVHAFLSIILCHFEIVRDLLRAPTKSFCSSGGYVKRTRLNGLREGLT